MLTSLGAFEGSCMLVPGCGTGIDVSVAGQQ